MPYTQKQKRFGCAEYGRAKRGQEGRSSMSKEEAKDLCVSKVKGSHKGSNWSKAGNPDKKGKASHRGWY